MNDVDVEATGSVRVVFIGVNLRNLRMNGYPQMDADLRR
jgi:hypothetical protein